MGENDDAARRAEEGLRRAEELVVEGRYLKTAQTLKAAQALDGQVGALAGPARRRALLVLAKGTEAALRALVLEDPQNAEAWRFMGTVWKLAGVPQRAAMFFRQAAEPEKTLASWAMVDACKAPEDDGS